MPFEINEDNSINIQRNENDAGYIFDLGIGDFTPRDGSDNNRPGFRNYTGISFTNPETGQTTVHLAEQFNDRVVVRMLAEDYPEGTVANFVIVPNAVGSNPNIQPGDVLNTVQNQDGSYSLLAPDGSIVNTASQNNAIFFTNPEMNANNTLQAVILANANNPEVINIIGEDLDRNRRNFEGTTLPVGTRIPEGHTTDVDLTVVGADGQPTVIPAGTTLDSMQILAAPVRIAGDFNDIGRVELAMQAVEYIKEVTNDTIVRENSSQEVSERTSVDVRPMTEVESQEFTRIREERQLVRDSQITVEQEVSNETIVTEEEFTLEETRQESEPLTQSTNHRVPNVVFPIVKTDEQGNPLKDAEGNVLFERNENGEILYKVEMGTEVTFENMRELRVAVGQPLDERGNLVLSANAYLGINNPYNQPEAGVSGAITASTDQIGDDGRPNDVVAGITIGGQVAYAPAREVTETKISVDGVTRTETDVQTINTNIMETMTLSEIQNTYGDRINLTEVSNFEEVTTQQLRDTTTINTTTEQDVTRTDTYIPGALTADGQNQLANSQTTLGEERVTSQNQSTTTEVVSTDVSQTAPVVTSSESLQGTELIDSSTTIISQETQQVGSSQTQRVTDVRQTTTYSDPEITQTSRIEHDVVPTIFADAFVRTNNPESDFQGRAGIQGGVSFIDDKALPFADVYAEGAYTLSRDETGRSSSSIYVRGEQDLVNGQGLSVQAGMRFGGAGNVIRDNDFRIEGVEEARENLRNAQVTATDESPEKASEEMEFSGISDLDIQFTDVEEHGSPLGTGQTPQAEQLQR